MEYDDIIYTVCGCAICPYCFQCPTEGHDIDCNRPIEEEEME